MVTNCELWQKNRFLGEVAAETGYKEYTGWQRYFRNIFKALLTHENVAFSKSFAIPNLTSCL